jgi:hypothetical protein
MDDAWMMHGWIRFDVLLQSMLLSLFGSYHVQTTPPAQIESTVHEVSEVLSFLASSLHHRHDVCDAFWGITAILQSVTPLQGESLYLCVCIYVYIYEYSCASSLLTHAFRDTECAAVPLC